MSSFDKPTIVIVIEKIDFTKRNPSDRLLGVGAHSKWML